MMDIADIYFTTLPNLVKPFVLWTIFSYFLFFGLNKTALWFVEKFNLKKKNVRGQLALVTGGASGLGRAVALKLAQEGCNIVIADVHENNTDKTVKDLENMGISAKGYKVDVSKLDEIQKMKEKVEEEIGNFDIIINNAGMLFSRAICEEDPIYLQKMVNVNLMSQFWTTRTFLPDMIRRKRGHIVSISSLAGVLPCPAIATYATTKFAVRGFMESLAMDLAHDRNCRYIKTTTVYPYFIKTNPEIVDGYKNLVREEVFELLELDDATNQIVDAILREKEEVFVIKKNLKGFISLYIAQLLPFWLKKYFIIKTVTKGYKWNGLIRRNEY